MAPVVIAPPMGRVIPGMTSAQPTHYGGGVPGIMQGMIAGRHVAPPGAASSASPALAPGSSNLLIVTLIPSEAKEQDVKALCQNVGGEVTKLVFRQSDEEGLGWAFVSFATPEQAHLAKERIDRKIIGGYIFKAPLAAAIGEGIYGELKHGHFDPSKLGPWEEFKTPDGLPYWHNKETKQTTWTRPSVDAPAAGAGGEKQVVGASGPSGANLFVYHVPVSWDDNILKQHFEHFGQIISCKIQRDPDGRSKGFGFISYETAQAAKAAIAGMHGFPVDGKWLKVELKKGDEPPSVLPVLPAAGATSGFAPRPAPY